MPSSKSHVDIMKEEDEEEKEEEEEEEEGIFLYIKNLRKFILKNNDRYYNGKSYKYSIGRVFSYNW